MLRAVGVSLFLLSVVASLASATAAEPTLPETPDANGPIHALQQAGDAVASGASAAAEGIGAAASGAASLATAAGAALLGAAKALGSGIATAARFLGHLVVLAFGLLVDGAFLLGAGLAFLGGLVADLARLAGALLGKGAGFVRAHPAASGAAAGGAATLGLLAWLLKRLGGLGFLATLYTRLAPSQILDNEARARVYEHVKAHPGAHPSLIAERLQLGWGTVVYHLAKLEDSRLVTPRSAHNRKCYFAIGADLNAEARTAVAAMSTDKTRSIVETVRAQPGISQKELSERLGMSQALASWHVKRLVASGVLLTAREGRSNCLRVAGHVPVAA